MTTSKTKLKLGPNVRKIADLFYLAYQTIDNEKFLKEHNFHLAYHHRLGPGAYLSQLSSTECSDEDLIHKSTVLFFESGVYWAMNVPGTYPTGITPKNDTGTYGTSLLMGKDKMKPEQIAVIFLAGLMDKNPLYPPDQQPSQTSEELEEAEWLAKEEGNEEAIRQEWELNQ